MFWNIWRIVAGIIFVLFFVICFADGCSFIYHTETSGLTMAKIQLTMLIVSLVMLLIEIFFSD